AKAVLLATGGYGRVYRITSNALAFTGDGNALTYRLGIPFEDPEFFQFHPTGIYKMGILITEGARGEGGILRNRNGERFMERYAPTMKDLAPRDMISRNIYTEVAEGRGIDGKDYVHLDLTSLSQEVIHERLPDITDFVETYLGLDPTKELIPIQPTAHYAMGGIPTDVDGRVLNDEKNTPLPGLYAAGECACVSVHGANRLGTNSLVDIIVFGRRAGLAVLRYLKEAELLPLAADAEARATDQVARLRSSKSDERASTLRAELQATMEKNASVVRDAAKLKEAQAKVAELRERYNHVAIHDPGTIFNMDLIEAIEVGNLLDVAEAIVAGALTREESRGAHYREDFPKRDDAKFLKHTLIRRVDGKLEISYKPVVITRFEPKERKY
ncbi:MAG: FAD-binding protein, partial [Chloroflexota bacterium]